MENTLIPFIPSNLAPLLQIDLLVLEQTRKKNAAQHRSGLFFRRVHEIYRLGKEIYRVLDWMGIWVGEERERRRSEAFRLKHDIEEEGHEKAQELAEAEAGQHLVRLTMLLERIFPALSKASDSVTKMIHHLHFLPLTTLLQAAYARIWVISTTIYAHVKPRNVDGSMTAVLSEQDVVNFGSGHSDLKERLEVAKAELDSRACDLPGQKGKAREESIPLDALKETNSKEAIEDDLLVDFGTKVERPSSPVMAKAPLLKPLPKVAARIRKASPPIPMPFSRAGSGSSTPIGDQTVFLPDITIREKPKHSGTAGGLSQEGGAKNQPAKKTKKRPTDIDDLFGGLSGGSQVGEKKRKLGKGVDERPPSCTPSGSDTERQGSREASMTTTPVVEPDTVKAKGRGKRVEEAAKLKTKKKKKKGDDLDDIFGF